MKIQDIVDYDDNSNEQDVLVTDELYVILCYYCGKKKLYANMQIKNSLFSLSTHNICKADKKMCYAKKLDISYYAYELCGKLVSRGNHSNIIKIGELTIEISDAVPKDIEIGDYIYFTADRLDIL